MNIKLFSNYKFIKNFIFNQIVIMINTTKNKLKLINDLYLI